MDHWIIFVGILFAALVEILVLYAFLWPKLRVGVRRIESRTGRMKGIQVIVQSTRKEPPSETAVVSYLISRGGRRAGPVRLMPFEEFHLERKREDAPVFPPFQGELKWQDHRINPVINEEDLRIAWGEPRGYIVATVRGARAKANAAFYVDLDRDTVVSVRWWKSLMRPRLLLEFVRKNWAAKHTTGITWY